MARQIPARLTRREGRQFGLAVGGAFALLAVIAAWRGRLATASVLGAVALVLLLGGLLAPLALLPVRGLWMRGAQALSRVTTPVFLGVLYFVIVTPVGFAYRRLRGNPLRGKGARDGEWQVRPAGSRRGDLHRQF